MRRRYKAFALTLSVVVVLSTIAFLLHEPPPSPPPRPLPRGVFVATDVLTGEPAPSTTHCEIYLLENGEFVLKETVYSGSEMVLRYYSGVELYLRIWDRTNSSICPRFLQFEVPYLYYRYALFDIEVDIMTMPDLWHMGAKGSEGQEIIHNYSIPEGQHLDLWFGIDNPTNNTGFMASWDFLTDREYGALFYVAVNTSNFGLLSVQFRPFYDGQYMMGFYDLSDDNLRGYFNFGFEADLWEAGIYEFHYGLLWGVDLNEFLETGSWGEGYHEFSHGFMLEVYE